MRLFDTAIEYGEILQMIEDEGTSSDKIVERLEELDTDYRNKTENIAVWIKELKAEANAIKNEEKALAERRKAKENKAENLQGYLTETMKAKGDKKFESPKASITLCKSESVNVYNPSEAYSAGYGQLVQEYIPDKNSIRKAIKDGKDCSQFATTETREYVRIK